MKTKLSSKSIGKRVSSLLKQRPNKSLTSHDNEVIMYWLSNFDGHIPNRFSTRVGYRLMDIVGWSNVTLELAVSIREFINKYPRLTKEHLK